MRSCDVFSSDVVISDFGGVPRLFDKTTRLLLQLLGAGITKPIVLITDSDNEPLKLRKERLENFFNTGCKKHNIEPSISQLDENTLEVRDDKSGRAVKVFVYTVPQNLEHQVTETFREKYMLQDSEKNPKEIIRDCRQTFQRERGKSICRSGQTVLLETAF
ncbi:MAG: hypothetical protein QXY84_05545 [Candidatus Caldarchaeum sp.]